MPGPTPHQLDLEPFEAALADAATSVEASAVVLAALDAADQIIRDLAAFLQHAAYRYPDPARSNPDSRQQLWRASRGLVTALAAADVGVEAALRKQYDPAPAKTRPTSQSALPPSPPPAAPPIPRL
ncbi:hypothetical protein ABT117_19675 [Streptomyces sp. NPDC002262]|uniref:hypothetical protein n=1 Tax=Streptomyces sp. NPDC002262 TaxID=3154414 RepID=UPI00332F1C16